MIPKPAMVTGLLLVVAVLAFAGLAYQQVPMSTTQTIGYTSTQVNFSYPKFLATTTAAYVETTSYVVPTPNLIGASCSYTTCCATIPLPQPTLVCFTNGPYEVTVESTYQAQETATIPYRQTLTSSITEISTSVGPASAALGLTDGSFTALAAVVIGILVFLTAWATLKPKIVRTKQATITQFVKAPSSCLKCGAALPPASEYCNKCGTKQT